jgi:hypothetical protein
MQQQQHQLPMQQQQHQLPMQQQQQQQLLDFLKLSYTLEEESKLLL